MRASHSFCLPPISATQWSFLSFSCVTDFTPSMKRGKSSNCVHWLYTVLIGALTSNDFSIFSMMNPPLLVAPLNFPPENLPPFALGGPAPPAARAAAPLRRRLPAAAPHRRAVHA